MVGVELLVKRPPWARCFSFHISEEHPICPVSILTLAAERITRNHMLIVNNHLTETGAEYKLAETK